MPRATMTLSEYHRQMTNHLEGDATDDWNEAHIETEFGWRELWDIAHRPNEKGELSCLIEPGRDIIMPLTTNVRGMP